MLYLGGGTKVKYLRTKRLIKDELLARVFTLVKIITYRF